MKEKLSTDDYTLMYETLQEYLEIIDCNKIKESFYITDVRKAKMGQLYKLLHKLRDETDPIWLRYYPWC